MVLDRLEKMQKRMHSGHVTIITYILSYYPVLLLYKIFIICYICKLFNFYVE